LKLEVRPHASDARINFQRMRAAFERAWTGDSNHRWQSSCMFAGRPARLRISGHGLAKEVARAFTHLLNEKSSEPHWALRIDLWDEQESGVVCPVESTPIEERLLSSTSYVEFGLIMGSVDERFVASQRSGIITWLDRERQHLVGCVSRHDQLSLYDRGKPLHLPLLLWHNDQSAQVLHAALVSATERGVLLAGKGGAGKSTVALACLEAGLGFVGDDYIALEDVGRGDFAGHSLYSTSWVMADHLKRFSRLAPHAVYPQRPLNEKTLLLLAEVFPDRLFAHAPIRALVLPRITAGSSVSVRPASKAEALFALAPSSILLRPGAGTAAFEKLARLVDSVPCWQLELGGDVAAIAGAMDEILRSPACPSEAPLR
jgi:hypothetical protein